MAVQKKIEIIYDIQGKPVDVAIDKTINLKQQIRLLTSELSKVKEGSAEFQVLSTKLSDSKDQMERMRSKSQDLFAALSLLPGPVGSFFGQLTGAIGLMKTFTSFSLKDISFQFKELKNDLFDVYKNLFGAKEAADDLANTNQKLAENTNQAAQATNNNTTAVAAATSGYSKLSNEQVDLVKGLDMLEMSNENVNTSFKKGEAFIQVQGQEVRKLTSAELDLIKSGQALTVTEEGLVTVTNSATKSFGAATLAGRLFGGALNWMGVSATAATVAVGLLEAALAALGIGLIIAAVVGLVTALKDMVVYLYEGQTLFGGWSQSIRDAKKELEDINDTIERTNTLLDLDKNDMKRRQAEYIAYLKSKGNGDKELRGQQIKDLKEELALVQQATYDIGGEQNRYMKNREATVEGLQKIEARRTELEQQGKDLRSKIKVAELDDITATNKKILEDNKAANQKQTEADAKKYAKALADLDAQIENEINREDTRRDELQKLLDEKREMMTTHDELTYAQIVLLKHNNSKKIDEALKEDAVKQIQSEIDKNDRMMIEAGKGADLYYTARREKAQAEFQKELVEAQNDQNKMENARTKYWKALQDIDEEELQNKLDVSQKALEAEYDGSVKFFDAQRKVEEDSYKLAVQKAQANYDLLQQLKREHEKKMNDIDVAQIQAKADLEGRKAATVNEITEQHFVYLRNQENLNNQAQVKAAGDNADALEVIGMEHAQRMRDIEAQGYEARKQVQLAIIGLSIQFGQTLSQIGNVLLQEAQGRDEKRFKNAQIMAVAGIAIEKAAAIGQIWTNNAIANAKAIAAFPLTFGQPWVTINTVSAALSTAATIAAAAQAISGINSQNFTPDKSSSGSGNPYGRNYEQGGVIGGERHYNGGTMIEAEKGEAIMTRGAVTMFAPMLSMMNQLGGGTSFVPNLMTTSPDAPKSGYPSDQQTEQAIIKTYVVEGDLTSAQQRQARLKDLSTL